MLLLIDNFDSFTYNLVHAFEKLGQKVHVERNTKRALDLSSFAYLVIGPGPGTPLDAGCSKALIQQGMGKLPILGICLGHQAIGEVFGGNVVRAHTPMHGKISSISHHNQGVFKGLPLPFVATRYHSLLIERVSLPDCLEITAETEIKEIMGVRHRSFPIEGVQFHPESIATPQGMDLLANFLQS